MGADNGRVSHEASGICKSLPVEDLHVLWRNGGHPNRQEEICLFG